MTFYRYKVHFGTKGPESSDDYGTLEECVEEAAPHVEAGRKVEYFTVNVELIQDAPRDVRYPWQVRRDDELTRLAAVKMPSHGSRPAEAWAEYLAATEAWWTTLPMAYHKGSKRAHASNRARRIKAREALRKHAPILADKYGI